MYKTEYLPSARRDMSEIVRYISGVLKNPAAAERLAEELVAEGERLAVFPYANPSYLPLKPLKHEYRKAKVRGYLMFYWVEEEKKRVTVARVIYAGRDHERLLEENVTTFSE